MVENAPGDNRYFVLKIPRRGCLVGLGIYILLAIVIIALHPVWLRVMGEFLIETKRPRQADAIIALGGGGGDRCDKAAELYLQGYAPLVITSGGAVWWLPEDTPTLAELAAERIAARGVPRRAIRTLTDTATTQDEAASTRRLAEEENIRSLILVTDLYHTHRAALIFRRELADLGVDVIPVAVNDSPPFDPGSWWHGQAGLLVVFNEYAKLGYFLLSR